MKIGVVGATGKAGSFIVKEALNRGHDVTAIVRDASKVEERDVRTLEKDILISRQKISKVSMPWSMRLSSRRKRTSTCRSGAIVNSCI